MSARDNAERLLHDAAQLPTRPELQTARAAVAQGHALLAIADAVERFIEAVRAVGEASAKAAEGVSKLGEAMAPPMPVDQAINVIESASRMSDIARDDVRLHEALREAERRVEWHTTDVPATEVADAASILRETFPL